jgi:Spy/CpxP family protein refolding chaperone
MKIKRIIVAMAMASAVAVPAIALGASSASAAGSTSCDAGHGAPGGLGRNSPYYWVRNDPGFGQEQGVITGQTNSGFSASCN